MSINDIIQRLIEIADPAEVQENSFSYGDRTVPGGVAESWSFSVYDRNMGMPQAITAEIRSMGGYNKLKVYMNGAEAVNQEMILVYRTAPLVAALERLRAEAMSNARHMLESFLEVKEDEVKP